MSNCIRPLISIIMSAYNSEKYIKHCIISVLNQSYTHFEFIIIDDFSQDKTLSIIQSFRDSRIKIIRNSSNKGLTKNLNVGIEQAQGKYIARIDSDDICAKKRFESQIKFMERHPEVDVLGTNAFLINDNNEILGKSREAISCSSIKAKLIIANPFIHPSIIMRTEFAKRYLYNEEYRTCQDYELWSRASYSSVYYSLRKPLIFYRINQTGATRSARNDIKKRINLLSPIVKSNFLKAGMNLDDEDIYNILSILLINSLCDKENAWKTYKRKINKSIVKSLDMSCLRYFGLNFLIKKLAFFTIARSLIKTCLFFFGCLTSRISVLAKKRLSEAINNSLTSEVRK